MAGRTQPAAVIGARIGEPGVHASQRRDPVKLQVMSLPHLRYIAGTHACRTPFRRHPSRRVCRILNAAGHCAVHATCEWIACRGRFGSKAWHGRRPRRTPSPPPSAWPVGRAPSLHAACASIHRRRPVGKTSRAGAGILRPMRGPRAGRRSDAAVGSRSPAAKAGTRMLWPGELGRGLDEFIGFHEA